MKRVFYTELYMTNTLISEAIATFEELLGCLDDAYWEASSIEGKDRFYNLINAIQQEMSELNKLSVQDHNLPYEVINIDFSVAIAELGKLAASPEKFVLRTKTARRLVQATNSLTKQLC